MPQVVWILTLVSQVTGPASKVARVVLQTALIYSRPQTARPGASARANYPPASMETRPPDVLTLMLVSRGAASRVGQADLHCAATWTKRQTAQQGAHAAASGLPAYMQMKLLAVWISTRASAGRAIRLDWAALRCARTRPQQQTALKGAHAAATTALRMLRILDALVLVSAVFTAV